MLVALLAGFELNRRRAERAQGKAEPRVPGEAEPAQHHAGAAGGGGPEHGRGRLRQPGGAEPRACAPARGSATGSRPTRGRAPTTSACRSPDPSRAAPTACPSGARRGRREEERYAIVRSVAVTAPIEALHADERHRLGILFLVEPEADLALLTEDLESETRRDERRQLAGLLSPRRRYAGPGARPRPLRCGRSGVLRPSSPPGSPTYVDRRLRTTAWLLDHWDAEPPLPPDSSIEAAQARATLERPPERLRPGRPGRRPAHPPPLGQRRALRCVRSARPSAPVFTVEIDWPEEFWFTCPVRGGFGFFLGEVLINAIRHGRPGSTPALRITLDRVRRELVFEVENDLRSGASDRPGERGETYGGRSILRPPRPPLRMAGPDRSRSGRRAYLVSWQRARERAGGSAAGRLKGVIEGARW